MQRYFILLLAIFTLLASRLAAKDVVRGIGSTAAVTTPTAPAPKDSLAPVASDTLPSLRIDYAALADSLSRLVRERYEFSLADLDMRYASWHYERPDTLANPYYFPLFAAPTLYPPAVHEQMGLYAQTNNPLFAAEARSLAYVYTRQPWLVRQVQPEEEQAPIPETAPEVKPKVTLSDKPSAQYPEEITLRPSDLHLQVRKPNFWSFPATFKLQLMQNYVSDNWYKGGESSNSFLIDINAQANFDNKQHLKFYNKLEARLGFLSSRSDEKHKYKTNVDLLRLTNEVGIKAANHWYYSAMLQSWTQFWRGHKKNDEKIYSDFMSPFESLLTLGMKYELETKNKRFKLGLNLSPLAVYLKYVGRPSLQTAFGLEEGHSSKFEFGSNITATHSWTIMKNVTWSGRFYFYTNYHKTQIEWENTINLQVNRFLSTQLFLFPRFDDSAKRADPSRSYFQFMENLTIGLNISI